MGDKIHIPSDHPRAESLRIREKLIEGLEKGLVAKAGLIAHGRGEAFDYIIGEETRDFAEKAMEAAVALFLMAKKPVFSVNGNVAALTPREYVELSELVGAELEVNLFYRTREREKAIAKVLLDAGAKRVLGVDEEERAVIEEISHMRRFVDRRGIYIADVVFVPLEDGDRTMALRKLGKKVVTIDLNPLSRTAQWAHVTIVDNLVRALPRMIEMAREMRDWDREKLSEVVENYRNDVILSNALSFMSERLRELAKKGIVIEEVKGYS